MNIIIISGLLGSGKTTFLLKLARKLQAYNKQIVIIENEVGEIGIDGQYLQMEGLLVQELYSGCVCCTLAVDLVSTLHKVSDLYKPDTVIIEVSGVARLANVLSLVKQHISKLNIVPLTIVDATRYFIYKEMLLPLMESNLAAADVVIINKIDGVSATELVAIKDDIKDFLADKKAFLLSALKDDFDNALSKELTNNEQ